MKTFRVWEQEQLSVVGEEQQTLMGEPADALGPAVEGHLKQQFGGRPHPCLAKSPLLPIASEMCTGQQNQEVTHGQKGLPCSSRRGLGFFQSADSNSQYREAVRGESSKQLHCLASSL